MYVVIAGGGRLGASLAGWLISGGHEVSVVDFDRATCVRLDETLGSVSVLGSCIEAEALARAGTNRADVFAATTRDDGVNVVACQLARHHFGVSRTMSVVNDRDNADLFGLLGIGASVDVTNLVLGGFQEGFSTRGMMHLMPMTSIDGKTLVSVKIPPIAGTEERLLGRIPLPEGTLVTLVITRDGSVSIPTAETTIKAGDEVVVVTTATAEEELREVLIGPLVE